jgi:MFS family permease
LQQWSGNGLGYFLPILFGAAGANTQNQRLTLNFANTIVSASGALIGTSLTDKVGRRKMWFWGTVACSATLAIVTGCTAKWGDSGANPAGANAAIAFICELKAMSCGVNHDPDALNTVIFGFVYSLAYTPLQALYPAECLHYNTRAKGMATYVSEFKALALAQQLTLLLLAMPSLSAARLSSTLTLVPLLSKEYSGGFTSCMLSGISSRLSLSGSAPSRRKDAPCE